MYKHAHAHAAVCCGPCTHSGCLSYSLAHRRVTRSNRHARRHQHTTRLTVHTHTHHVLDVESPCRLRSAFMSRTPTSLFRRHGTALECTRKTARKSEAGRKNEALVGVATAPLSVSCSRDLGYQPSRTANAPRPRVRQMEQNMPTEHGHEGGKEQDDHVLHDHEHFLQ